MTSSHTVDRQGSPQPTTVHDPDALRGRAIIELMHETQVDVDLDDAIEADIMIDTVEPNDFFESKLHDESCELPNASATN